MIETNWRKSADDLYNELQREKRKSEKLQSEVNSLKLEVELARPTFSRRQLISDNERLKAEVENYKSACEGLGKAVEVYSGMSATEAMKDIINLVEGERP